MKVRTKIIDKSIFTPLLRYAKQGDAGIDLTATSKRYDSDGNIVYGTNRAFEIPEGYVGLLFPRSSNSKKDLRLTNSVGVLDSGYRGEILFKFRNDNFASMNPMLKNDLINGQIGFSNEYEIGDRIGQLIIIPYPTIEFEEVDELSETERGAGGYGSTGE